MTRRLTFHCFEQSGPIKKLGFAYLANVTFPKQPLSLYKAMMTK
jgi:hypothetical protein